MTFRPTMAAFATAGAVVAYGRVIRPRLLRWGATDVEVHGPYPGADVVPGGKRGATMARTIDAPPEHVWPWLLQLGGDRAGWYSWDTLDNAGRPSARAIHPEWQSLAVGDPVRYRTRRHGVVDAWTVAALEPNRFLGLHGLSDLRGHALDPAQPRPASYTEGLWGFQLSELPGGRTRLVIGGYEVFRAGWLGGFVSFWLGPLVVWIMQARMLAVLKRNAEAAAASSPRTRPAGSISAGSPGPPRESLGRAASRSTPRSPRRPRLRRPTVPS